MNSEPLAVCARPYPSVILIDLNKSDVQLS
jgi:hypothetical protein